MFKFKNLDEKTFIGRLININNKQFEITDANENNRTPKEVYPLVATLRFLRLPPNIQLNAIKEFINSQKISIVNEIELAREKYFTRMAERTQPIVHF